jgi:hypothetical protein
MAFGALIPFVFVFSAINWKKSIVVVKCRWRPTGVGRMTGGAIGGKARRNVVWIRGLVVIVQVTSHALRRRARISIGMAGGTFQGNMRPSQRKSRRIVVK